MYLFVFFLLFVQLGTTFATAIGTKLNEDVKKVSDTCDPTILETDVGRNVPESVIQNCSGNVHVPQSSDYNSEKKMVGNKYNYTEPNANIASSSVLLGKMDTTFCREVEEEEEEELEVTKDNFLYASECVQILDQIPFQSDDIDDEDIDYYDSLINT